MKDEIVIFLEKEISDARAKRKICDNDDIECRSYYDGRIDTLYDIRHFVKNELHVENS